MYSSCYDLFKKEKFKRVTIDLVERSLSWCDSDRFFIIECLKLTFHHCIAETGSLWRSHSDWRFIIESLKTCSSLWSHSDWFFINCHQMTPNNTCFKSFAVSSVIQLYLYIRHCFSVCCIRHCQWAFYLSLGSLKLVWIQTGPALSISPSSFIASPLSPPSVWSCLIQRGTARSNPTLITPVSSLLSTRTAHLTLVWLPSSYECFMILFSTPQHAYFIWIIDCLVLEASLKANAYL